MGTPTSSNVDATLRETKAWIRCIALGALAVGLADWLQAYLVFALPRHSPPTIGLLQGPATGLLGRAAMQGGAQTALLGTILHFSIAFVWVALFAVLYRTSPALRQRVRATGGLLLVSAATGATVWLTMDWVVLRFSRAHFYPLSEANFWILLVGHMPFVGFPIVWTIRRFAPQQRQQPQL
jgi:hypothetical protein